MLVFDITDRKSFENIKTYYQKIIRCKEDALIFLIGNKCDLERDRKVAYEEVCDYFEILPSNRGFD